MTEAENRIARYRIRIVSDRTLSFPRETREAMGKQDDRLLNQDSATKPKEEDKGSKSWAEENGGLIFLIIIVSVILLLILYDSYMH